MCRLELNILNFLPIILFQSFFYFLLFSQRFAPIIPLKADHDLQYDARIAFHFVTPSAFH